MCFSFRRRRHSSRARENGYGDSVVRVPPAAKVHTGHLAAVAVGVAMVATVETAAAATVIAAKAAVATVTIDAMAVARAAKASTAAEGARTAEATPPHLWL